MMNIFQLGQFGRRVIDQGGGGGGGGNRTFADLTSDITSVSTSSTAISWSSSSLDGLGAWSGANPSRLTAPSAGYYTAYVVLSYLPASGQTGGTIEIRKNGSASWSGYAANKCDTALYAGDGSIIAQTALIYLNSGDYLECYFTAAVSGGTIFATGSDTPSVMMLYKESAATAVHLSLASAYAISASGTFTSIPWDTDNFDTENTWVSGSPTDIVTPSGFTYLAGTVSTSSINNANSAGGASFRLAGAGPDNVGRVDNGNFITSANFGIQIATSSQVATVAGYSQLDASFSIAADSNVGVEWINDDCGIISRNANTTITSTNYTCVWTTETADDAGFIDVAGQPTRITSPGGWVQAGCVIRASSLTGNVLPKASVLHYNSGGTLLAVYGRAFNNTGIATNDAMAWTPHINTTAGDYFTFVFQSNDASWTFRSGSYAWIRKFAA